MFRDVVPALLASVTHPPNTSPMPIPARVFQAHFIMTNDPIVKIRDVEAAVGRNLNVDWPKPRIGCGKKIRLFCCQYQ